MNTKNWKELWQQQKIAPSDILGLHRKVEDFKRKGLIEVLKINIAGLTFIIAFSMILYDEYTTSMLTTKIGLSCLILACVFYLFHYNKLLPLFYKVRYLTDSKSYIKELLRIKKTQKKLQTQILNTYFILITIGICLGIYEYLAKTNLIIMISIYCLMLLWVSFNTFYLRPKTIQRQNKKLDELIGTCEEVEKEMQKHHE